MEKITQKELKRLVRLGVAVDMTTACNREDITEPYTIAAVSSGVYGLNGLLMQGDSGQLYAVCTRSSALFLFY